MTRNKSSWIHMERAEFADRVLKWAEENPVDLPWRRHRSPYEILVAEVLLKRTTATAAARVYEDSLIAFPSLRHIVAASGEELVEMLSGVGLQYQRAQAMQRLAAWILYKHGGCIPSDLGQLLDVPGLGNYSATAILSFGFDIPAAVVDTNVERIINRVFGSNLPARPSRTLLHDVATDLLPKDRHREYNYALLDLGRLICKYADPRCGKCPLASGCNYYHSGGSGSEHELEKGNAVFLQSNLRAVRRDRGLSQKQLAESAKVSKLTVIRIESGSTSPRRGTLEKLAVALDTHPENLSG